MWYTPKTQNGQPFYKGPLPPFIDQGGEGVTMWDKCSHPFLMYNSYEHVHALHIRQFALSS